MNAEQTPPKPVPSSFRLSPSKARHRHFPNLASWLVAIFVLGTLLSMILDGGGSHVQIKGAQTKALAQAKQIGLALKAFAMDHDGNYPRADLPAMLGAEVKDSNAAFAVLFPDYLTNEALFANRTVHGSHPPDNLIDSPYTGRPVKTLEPGENVYSYVAGLKIGADDHAPLIADGTDGTGHYTTDTQKPGGVWAGQKAIVVFLDQSAVVQPLVGPEHARYLPASRTGNPDGGNLLDVSGLGPDVRLLDPVLSR